MAIQTLYSNQSDQDRGQTVWHNPTDAAACIKLHGVNGPLKPIEVPPGAEISIDSGYDKTVPGLCPALEMGPAPSKSAPATPAKEAPAQPSETRQQRRARERAESEAAKDVA